MRSLRQFAIGLGPGWRTVLSAVLVTAAYPPWDLSQLVWVALVPWLMGLRRTESFLGSVIQGFWLGFCVAMMAAPWLAYAIHEFLGVSWPLAALGLIVFAATCGQPQFLFFAPLFHWVDGGLRPFRAGSLTTGIGIALCYSGLDWIVPRLFDVGLGYALHGAANLRQLADVGGVALLTFLIVLVNLLVWQALESRLRRSGASSALLSRAACIAILCGGTFLYGALRNRDIAELVENPQQIVRAGLVQGSVANEIRLAWARGDDRAAERQLSAYMLLTEEFIERKPRPDIVVWPEATFPGVFRKPASRLQEGRAVKFDRQVLRLNVPIVFGAYDLADDQGHRTLFNSLFAISPIYDRPGRQGVVQRYRKHELLPFAETIPGVSESEWIHRLLPSLGFFGRGPGAEVFQIPLPDGRSLRVGPIICSESLYSQHVIAGAKRGSELILNVGSDGWFGPYGEPEFHLAISRFRSIETRLPQIRSANTGISALILPTGEIARRSELGKRQILDLEVPISPAPQTLVKAWGDWFGRLALVLALGFALLHALNRRSAE
jgi:apolipoprotein N-acyltransferase